MVNRVLSYGCKLNTKGYTIPLRESLAALVSHLEAHLPLLSSSSSNSELKEWDSNQKIANSNSIIRSVEISAVYPTLPDQLTTWETLALTCADLR